MEITVHLPNDLTRRPDPGREALEALAIAGYRSGKFSDHEAGTLLGFTSRFQFEAFLKSNDILDHSYGPEDLADDVRTLRNLRG
ncbi:MAG TPA: UPF0175 family protein [Candidatus Acidoferrum sp.]|nr:UPF0175 family protein [Candidatus Acidoferrum sp.]